MSSTDRTNGDVLFLAEMLSVFIFTLLLPSIQDLYHWFIPVGVCVQVAKYDVDYGISLDFS